MAIESPVLKPTSSWSRVAEIPDENDGMSLEDFAKGAFAAGDAAPTQTTTAKVEAKPAETKPTPTTPPTIKPAEPAEKTTTGPEIWRPKKAQDWQVVHAESDKRLQRAVAAEEKAKELEAKLAQFDPKVIETLSKERDDLRTRLSEVGLELDPEFSREFDTKKRTLVNLAKQAAGEKAPQIETLLNAPPSDWKDGMIDGIMADLTPARQARLLAALSNLDTLNMSRADQLSNATTILERKRMERQQESVRRQREHLGVFDGQLSAWTDPKDGLPVFQEQEGNDAWNTKVKERVSIARHLYSGNGLSADDLANAALRASAFDGLLESHMEANKEVERLTEELAKFTGAVPKPPGGASGEVPSGDGGVEKEYASGIVEGLQREGLMPGR
jgi:hypothetical protein